MDWMTGPLRQRLVSALVVLVGGLILTPLIMQLPLLGFDWQACFEAEGSFLPPLGDCYAQYPPWTPFILRPWTILPWRVGLSFQLGMMLMAVAVSTAKGAFRYAEAVVLALFTPPILWLLWLGQIDGLALWGLMFMPFGILWALTKPNITVWALFARWQWVAVAAVVGIVSVLIWGWWPETLLAARSHCTQHPAAMGWVNTGWPVLVLGLLLFPFSGSDPLRLMASGALLMPFVMPYHFMMLLPALGRVRSYRRWFLWGLAWTTAAVPAFGGWTKYLALSFPIAVWILVSPDPFQRQKAFIQRIRKLFVRDRAHAG
jgi:hypothetical protein